MIGRMKGLESSMAAMAMREKRNNFNRKEEVRKQKLLISYQE